MDSEPASRLCHTIETEGGRWKGQRARRERLCIGAVVCEPRRQGCNRRRRLQHHRNRHKLRGRRHYAAQTAFFERLVDKLVISPRQRY
jgi:hypothetical protein